MTRRQGALLIGVLALPFLALATSQPTKPIPRDPRVQLVYLDEDRVATIFVSQMGTVISFPTKPAKVLLGRAGSFGLEYIESDLALTPLQLGASSNLFVYILGRRFSFNLKTSPVGPSIVKVRDSKERIYRGEFK